MANSLGRKAALEQLALKVGDVAGLKLLERCRAQFRGEI